MSLLAADCKGRRNLPRRRRGARRRFGARRDRAGREISALEQGGRGFAGAKGMVARNFRA